MDALLPIGTVVKLKGTEKNMMICGYCATSEANQGKIYDYSGFAYPEGYVDTFKIYQFDGEQIEDILAVGYQDKEMFVYMKNIKDKVNTIRNKLSNDEENIGGEEA